MSGLVHPNTLVAVTRDLAVDDTWIDRANRLVIQPKARHHTRSEVLYQHIGSGDKLMHSRQVCRVFQIRREALFIAIDRMKERAFAVQFKLGDIKLSAEIATVRPLDLDHTRAQIGQAQCRRGTRQKYAEIEFQ